MRPAKRFRAETNKCGATYLDLLILNRCESAVICGFFYLFERNLVSGAVRLHVSHAVCAPTRHARGRGASLLTAFAELEPLCQSTTGLALHDELLAVPTEGANADDLHGQAKAIRQKAGDASATDMAGGSV